MTDVKCTYCGTLFYFPNGLHKEVKRGDFRKYLHFCNDHHFERWKEQLNNPAPEKGSGLGEAGHLSSIEKELK